MLSVTTPATVQNVTRFKVTAALLPDADIDNTLIVTAYALCPPGGKADDIQLRRCYGGGPQILRIRNTVSDSISFNTDTDVNPYTGLLLRGTVSVSGLLDTCIAAMVAAGNNTRNQLKALETALSSAGVLPAGTVA